MGKYSNVLSSRITGNVGAMNFRMKDGEIVAAQRSYTNKSKGDGASYSQREHRARLANVVDFFKAIALIEKRGWENKKPNQSDFNCFTAVNLSASPVFLTKQEAELGAAVAAPYAASRGSLSVIPGYYEGLDSTAFVLGLNFGNEAIDWDTETIGSFSARIINNNQGWQQGDKLSICAIDQLQRVVAGVTIPQVEVTYLEISLDLESTTLLDSIPNWNILQFDITADKVLLILDGKDAAFAIHSRESAGYLETSAQDVVLKNPGSPIFAKYASGEQKKAAMESYGFQDMVLLDPNSENGSSFVTGATVTNALLDMDGDVYFPTNGKVIPFATDGQLLVEGAGFVYGDNIKVQNFFNGNWLTVGESDGIMARDNRVEANVLTQGDWRLIVNGVEMFNFKLV